MSAQSGEVPAEAIKSEWRLDALWAWRHDIDQNVRTLIDKVATILHMRSERGPRDHELNDHDIARRVARIIAHEYGSRQVTYNNGDGERPRNGEKRLLAWILGVLALLLVGGTGGVISMYGKLSSIEKGQEGHEQRINRLEAERDRR
jgi:hypothetical protein